MHLSHLRYLPLPVAFFSILVGIFLVVVALFETGALQYACIRLDISPRAALLLLFASLVGSCFNIPVAELPEEHVATGREIAFYGMRYVVPVVVEWPGTVIAVNVGGALIPGVMSIYLLLKQRCGAAESLQQVVLRQSAISLLVRSPDWASRCRSSFRAPHDPAGSPKPSRRKPVMPGGFLTRRGRWKSKRTSISATPW